MKRSAPLIGRIASIAIGLSFLGRALFGGQLLGVGVVVLLSIFVLGAATALRDKRAARQRTHVIETTSSGLPLEDHD